MVTMKMLRYDAQLRNDGRLPDFVEAPIEEIVTLQQTEETKHVYKVFSSIPLHGVLKLCMLDLKEVVHPQTLRHFASELKKLRDERKQKRDKEERSYQMHSEDASWKQYVERYNCSSEATYTDSQMEGLPPMMLPSVGSQYSDHGLPPNTLDTRQRATKRGENLLETAPTEDTGVLSANVLQLVGGNTPRANANREVSPDSRATSNSCWTPGSAIKLFKK
ncbi:hypothetical protein AGDE_12515 [Angomonas deanei]|uniref:Uncharacterized protein n=1 Tax=Angomonas deanei TaxID=59799 RepID=A0A7G2CBB6_9TRYP|nr:hypothetical protein AGDE_12515 [Angomonas deanei]CAD2217106.1 hypothetical protein, conserved [Angomonas deanei]|eukprot:EPY24091.1 hypothetical protein AGDE_12515 [Angomonas deanei]